MTDRVDARDGRRVLWGKKCGRMVTTDRDREFVELIDRGLAASRNSVDDRVHFYNLVTVYADSDGRDVDLDALRLAVEDVERTKGMS